ncbi:ABC transporter substrate-binding protein [Vallitalea pronyensis]|uniref:ABC transporter substrate-binding protein n=1 Tax=Vallitalea pronyensis TaxID=1348613 RepID=A0A8J8MLE2_9FIRM|nr:ABC transporter substrate-binding protein [Vallitalea pronyensis]QUI23664.1 ABC transporter substrate-binding protein [Vallitalea pronyensis]
MFKKRLALILALVFVVSTMLMGCGAKKDDDKDPSDSTPSSNTDQDDKKEKPVQLTWYTIGTPQNDAEVVEEELNKYLLEKINATIDIKMLDWGEYDPKMQVKIGSGEKFDIMFSSSWANNFAANVSKGALLPLDDLLDEYGQGIKDNLHPLFLEGASIGGEVYGLPTNKELGWQAMWIINKDLADKYDMDISKINTLESLEPYLEIIKENEPDVIPLTLDKLAAPYIPNIDDFLGASLPFGIKFDDAAKIVNTYETEEAMGIFETMHRYYEKGYVHPDAAINTVGDYNKAGNYFVTKAHYQPYAEIIWHDGDFSSTEIAVMPVHEPYANNSSTRGAMQGISITSEHPEKAMEFLNLLYTDEYVINLIIYGIEGVHYNKVSETNLAKTEQAKTAYQFPGFSVGNSFNTYSLEGTPDDKWEKFEEFNNSSINAPSLGFTPDLSSIKTTMSAITNVAEEVNASIYLGAVDPAEYVPKAIEKFKAAGIDDAIAELQKQYDEWLKSQE